MITEKAKELAIKLILEDQKQKRFPNLSQDQAYQRIGQQLQDKAAKQAKKYWGQHLKSMNAERTAVILDMTYSMGHVRWPRLTKAIHQKNWNQAAEQIVDSKYYDQVGIIAQRNQRIMRDGIMHYKQDLMELKQ